MALCTRKWGDGWGRGQGLGAHGTGHRVRKSTAACLADEDAAAEPEQAEGVPDERVWESEATRLLCRLLKHLPFALPQRALRQTLTSFVWAVETLSQSRGAWHGGSPEEEHTAALRPLLPQLWQNVNAMLRQQGAEHGELVWDSLISCGRLLGAIPALLVADDKPLLLGEVVQFCRIALRLGSLLHEEPPGAPRPRPVATIAYLPPPVP